MRLYHAVALQQKYIKEILEPGRIATIQPLLRRTLVLNNFIQRFEFSRKGAKSYTQRGPSIGREDKI